MIVRRFQDRDSFARHVTPFLLEREAENNFFLGLVSRAYLDAATVLCAIEEGSDVVGVATMTPPWHMMVTKMPPKGAEMLARWLAREAIDVPGIQGDDETIGPFIAMWKSLHDVEEKPGKSVGIYSLDRVIAPPPVSGHFRVATLAETDLIIEWRAAFIRDIG